MTKAKSASSNGRPHLAMVVAVTAILIVLATAVLLSQQHGAVILYEAF